MCITGSIFRAKYNKTEKTFRIIVSKRNMLFQKTKDKKELKLIERVLRMDTNNGGRFGME